MNDLDGRELLVATFIPLHVKAVPGVYIIRNLVDGRAYVGSSINMRKRLREHRQRLTNRNHWNGYLQEAWTGYGGYSFRADVYQEMPGATEEELWAAEVEWIQRLQSHTREHGYNLDNGTRRTAGRISEETREKLRRSHMGYQPTEEHREKLSIAGKGRKRTQAEANAIRRGRVEAGSWKSVVVRDPDGNIYRPDNLKGFCQEYGLSYRSLLKQARRDSGGLQSGWVCRYDDGSGLEPVATSARIKSWKVTSPDGDARVIQNLNRFCKEYNLTMTAMCYVADGKCSHHKGWKCERLGK
jgi:group I intron endonuclease